MAKAKSILVWLSSSENRPHAGTQGSPNTILYLNRIERVVLPLQGRCIAAL